MLICFVLLCPPKFMKIPLALALIVNQFPDVPKTKTAAFTTPSAIGVVRRNQQLILKSPEK